MGMEKAGMIQRDTNFGDYNCHDIDSRTPHYKNY